MIIANLKGGLGNQLFQYACSKNIALKLNQELKFFRDKPFFSSSRKIMIGDIFNLKIKYISFINLSIILRFPAISLLRNLLASNKLSFLRPSSYIAEPSFTFWPGLFNLNNQNFYLHGYWQSYKYFEGNLNTIRQDLSFNDKFLYENSDNFYFKKILKVNSVSIHLRRGDFLTNPRAKKFHGVCSMAYYKKSINFIMQKVKNPHFFIFSDDIEWARSNFNFIECPFTFIEKNSDVVDFWLMSLCKHNVLANSTFSWWAGWLNKNNSKFVIAPKKWFLNSTISTRDLIPKNWYRF